MSNPSVVRRLILLRHGQTEWNADGRMQGQLDTGLTELGRTQAKNVALALADLPLVAIVSSDLHRASDTAALLGDAAQLPVATDDRLREVYLGDWQGLVHSEVDDRYPGARAAWRSDGTWVPPGGESRIDVANRALPVVTELFERQQDWAGGVVALVSHGGLIAALTAALLDLPVERWTVFGGLGNASWAQLSHHSAAGGRGSGWRLDVWNASARVAPDVF